MNELTRKSKISLQLGTMKLSLPAIVLAAGEHAGKRFIEFFTANIRNKNTREAYVEKLTQQKAAQTLKQHLAAIKSLFDFLVTGGVLTANPASAVRGPRHSQTKGKTPVLFVDDARELIRSIPTDNLIGLRDRAIISVMTYGFARVSAALAMEVNDVFPQHHRLWLRMIEKLSLIHI